MKPFNFREYCRFEALLWVSLLAALELKMRFTYNGDTYEADTEAP